MREASVGQYGRILDEKSGDLRTATLTEYNDAQVRAMFDTQFCNPRSLAREQASLQEQMQMVLCWAEHFAGLYRELVKGTDGTEGIPLHILEKELPPIIDDPKWRCHIDIHRRFINIALHAGDPISTVVRAKLASLQPGYVDRKGALSTIQKRIFPPEQPSEPYRLEFIFPHVNGTGEFVMKYILNKAQPQATVVPSLSSRLQQPQPDFFGAGAGI